MFMDKAKEDLDDLNTRFSQHDVFHMDEVQEEIALLKQRNMRITKFFTQLRIY